MIELPRRSVTRFFIPMIDVLTLLFCIFLLMPMVKPPPSSPTSAGPKVRRNRHQNPVVLAAILPGAVKVIPSFTVRSSSQDSADQA